MRKSIHSAQYAVFLRELVEQRSAAGVTQVQLAKRLRTTQSAVSKVERGERRLDVVELHAWCKALGVKLGDFSSALEKKLS